MIFLVSFSCLPSCYFSPCFFPLNKVFSSKWVKRDMEQQLKQWTFLPNSICMYWILGTHSEILSAHYEKLEHIFTHFSLPVFKLLTHILPM
jgi:hypothetical protein